MSSNFDMKGMGEASDIFGMKIIREPNVLILSQGHCVDKVLKKFKNIDVVPVRTPFDANNQLKKNVGEAIS